MIIKIPVVREVTELDEILNTGGEPISNTIVCILNTDKIVYMLENIDNTTAIFFSDNPEEPIYKDEEGNSSEVGSREYYSILCAWDIHRVYNEIKKCSLMTIN